MTENSIFDELFDCESKISQLEEDIYKKTDVLNKFSDKRKPKAVDLKWLERVKEVLPSVLLDITEELNKDLVDKNSTYLKIYEALKEIRKQQEEALIHLTKSVAKQKLEVKK